MSSQAAQYTERWVHRCGCWCLHGTLAAIIGECCSLETPLLPSAPACSHLQCIVLLGLNSISNGGLDRLQTTERFLYSSCLRKYKPEHPSRGARFQNQASFDIEKCQLLAMSLRRRCSCNPSFLVRLHASATKQLNFKI